jgi:P-type E1-E2 ATPase
MMRAATEVLVARRGSFSGTILIADNLRTEAVTAVHDLKHMGLRILLLTGDSKAVAESVAKALGVSSVYPELLPEQKLQKVAELMA